jgi:hypothetical protein
MYSPFLLYSTHHIETGTKSTAFATQDYRSNRSIGAQFRGSFRDGFKHGQIQAVEFVLTIQNDMTDSIGINSGFD